MIKKLLVFLIFILLAVLRIPSVSAADADFATSYVATYDISDDGHALVTENITLRNLTSEKYATQFKLIIGGAKITNIKAVDAAGILEPTIDEKDGSTSIAVKFRRQVAGMGKELTWSLQFESDDFAQKIGNVWEVSIPKIDSSANLEGYDLTVAVPMDFGEPTIVNPSPKKQVLNSGKRLLVFDKNQLQNTGLSVTFGNNQIFDFNLIYNLENSSLVQVLTSIALPPDTAYQDVILSQLDPKPINVTIDNDGNYLAWYKLGRRQQLKVNLKGSVRLYSNSKVKKPYLSPMLRAKYTQSDKYWEKDNPVIKNKLDEILGKNPPSSNTEKAKLIHRWVANNLKYDPTRLISDNTERLGAVTALYNPKSAVCIEFTDLFIALARAAGIPARELDGYAYSTNTTLRPLSLSKDILHSWPEYFDDDKGWMMIDPTWENTTGGVDYFNKLDLNHVAFAIKGFSSEYPAPAGSYKYNGQDSKDVQMNLSQNSFVGSSKIDLQVDAPTFMLAGFPNKIKIQVNNEGDVIHQAENLTVSAGKLTILEDVVQSVGALPPFGHAEFEYNVRTKTVLDSFDDVVNIQVGSQRVTKQIQVRPFILFRVFPHTASGIIIPILVIYLLILGGFIYRERFKKRFETKR